MDVTNGLISRLVKSKSTERVLAPIASQVSLLMILNDVEAEEAGSNDGSGLSISACVEKVTEAVDGFIKVGQDQINHSSDSIFDHQMTAALETLELAKTELYVAGLNVSGSNYSVHSHSALVTAAKDVLQAVLRVLVVVDDVEVRRCVQAIATLEVKVRNVGRVTDSRSLVQSFKALTEAALYVTMVVSRRKKDLVSSVQGEQLLLGLNLMRKGASSLRAAVQTFLKYPSNPQAVVGKEQVVDQALSCLADMRSTLESGPSDSLDAEEAGHFVDHIDKVLETLGESGRSQLHPDLESWLASIIRHAMGVAHLCQGTYRHLITRTCQRILQSKFRLLELHQSLTQSPHLTEIRLDYEGVCETLLDEFCEVEKHVNMALLNLIIDTCCFTAQPLEELASAAIHMPDDLGSDVGQSALAEEFLNHGDRLHQVAAMASASSMDPKKVRAVRLATSRLEQLQPEVVPAVGAVSRQAGNLAALRQLKTLVQDWDSEGEALVRALDSMTDPAVFLHVTEQRMRQGVNIVRGKVSERDVDGAKYGLQRLLAHARRMTQVATRVVDHHCNPIFRNGLMVFVQQLESARHGVKDASRSAMEDLSHARVVDTLHRRLGLLLDAAADLRQGVKGDNHVDLMNPAREKVRQQYLLSDKPSTEERVNRAKITIQSKRKNPLNRANAEAASKVNSAAATATEAKPEKKKTTGNTTPLATPEVPQAVVVTRASELEEKINQKRSHSSPAKSTRAPLKSPAMPKSQGETTAMLRTCGDELVTAAMSGESASVARWNGDILGWTSHLGEAAASLLEHCHQASRKSEMRELMHEMDRLAPLVVEAARFVAAGDRNQLGPLRLMVDDWVNACSKLRIVVDVAAGDWLVLTEGILQTATARDTQALKPLVNVLERNQREMSQLLGRAKTLEGQNVPKGRDIVQFFADGHLELDSLTATLATSADCVAISGDQSPTNRSQMVQRSREWSVLMTSLVAQLDHVARTLATCGQAVLGIPAVTATPGLSGSRGAAASLSKVVPLLKEETTRIRDVLTCLSSSSNKTVAARSGSLSASLVELLKEVETVASTPVDDTDLPQASLFARLDAGLAKSRWIEKALEANQLVQRHCIKFSALINNLLLTASTAENGADGYDAVAREVTDLQSKLKLVSQRAMQAIQVSADLQHRATVRRCLDDLNELLPVISQTASDCSARLEGEKSEQDLQKTVLQWGAKVYRLLATLRAMSDVKASVVNELERQLSVQPLEINALHQPSTTQPAATPPTLPTPSTIPPGIQNAIPDPRSSSSHASSDPTAAVPAPTRVVSAAQSYSPRTYSPSRRAPVPSVNSGRPSFSGIHTPLSGRHVVLSRDPNPTDRSERQGRSSPAVRFNSSPQTEESNGVVKPASEMSPYRRSALYTSWLASAQYLGEEVAGWEDSDNRFVQLVHTMARHCHCMADFARGGTSLRDSEEVAETGLALAASGKELEEFARSLLAMGPQDRHRGDLSKAADAISTYSRQLHIVSSVLHTGPANPQGSLEAREGSETDGQVLDLLTRWQHKLAAYRVQQASQENLDQLGLRRMEAHNPPTLTALAQV